MTARILAFPRLPRPHIARCDDCPSVRYYPYLHRAERWAVAHVAGYGHTVTVNGARIFGRIGGTA